MRRMAKLNQQEWSLHFSRLDSTVWFLLSILLSGPRNNFLVYRLPSVVRRVISTFIYRSFYHQQPPWSTSTGSSLRWYRRWFINNNGVINATVTIICTLTMIRNDCFSLLVPSTHDISNSNLRNISDISYDLSKKPQVGILTSHWKPSYHYPPLFTYQFHRYSYHWEQHRLEYDLRRGSRRPHITRSPFFSSLDTWCDMTVSEGKDQLILRLKEINSLITSTTNTGS